MVRALAQKRKWGVVGTADTPGSPAQGECFMKQSRSVKISTSKNSSALGSLLYRVAWAFWAGGLNTKKLFYHLMYRLLQIYSTQNTLGKLSAILNREYEFLIRENVKKYMIVLIYGGKLE